MKKDCYPYPLNKNFKEFLLMLYSAEKGKRVRVKKFKNIGNLTTKTGVSSLSQSIERKARRITIGIGTCERKERATPLFPSRGALALATSTTVTGLFELTQLYF